MSKEKFTSTYKIYIDKITNITSDIKKIEKNTLGGSDRKYFYIHGEKNIITFVDYNTITNQLIPYVYVSDFLNKFANVPQIYYYDDKVVLLEYIGQNTLFNIYKTKNKKFISYFYEILDILAEIQLNSYNLIKKDKYLSKRIFSKNEFLYEWNYYKEMYLLFYKSVNNDIINEKEHLYHKIINELVQLQYTFMHRDFQSQNFHIFNEKIYLIDFQTAYYGPFLYDVVSLIEDPYINLSNKEKNNALKKYYNKISNSHLCNYDFDLFYQYYLKTALLRLSQATAAYVKLGLKNNKTQFIQYIDKTAERVEEIYLILNSNI